ncbi:hypothetical protein BCR35DRAFT_327541 [Leucosporidium creatinivorum]|uniref:Uncharacterized protein n=1 Tax=Leucosporidium creatinivorum TaxID=106004 RepID=A0A1Y2G777_9BASI|nr:hypothetical protein BCR35DRAFT_327541 [Leucosporidium creatinivorum]
MEQALQQGPYASKYLWDLIPADPFQQPYSKKQCKYILSMLDSFTKLWIREWSARFLNLPPHDPNSTVPEMVANLVNLKLGYWIREARDVPEGEVQELGKEIRAVWEGTPNVVPRQTAINERIRTVARRLTAAPSFGYPPASAQMHDCAVLYVGFKTGLLNLTKWQRLVLAVLSHRVTGLLNHHGVSAEVDQEPRLRSLGHRHLPSLTSRQQERSGVSEEGLRARWA